MCWSKLKLENLCQCYNTQTDIQFPQTIGTSLQAALILSSLYIYWFFCRPVSSNLLQMAPVKSVKFITFDLRHMRNNRFLAYVPPIPGLFFNHRGKNCLGFLKPVWSFCLYLKDWHDMLIFWLTFNPLCKTHTHTKSTSDVNLIQLVCYPRL